MVCGYLSCFGHSFNFSDYNLYRIIKDMMSFMIISREKSGQLSKIKSTFQGGNLSVSDDDYYDVTNTGVLRY